MSIIKIGLAEDQAIFRKALIMLLNSFQGMEVVLDAENGSELLDKMAVNCPDIVILDYSMPLMGGIETAQAIRKKFPAVRVIILSMYDDEEFVEAAIENGANGYLSKDDDLQEIEQAIHGVLANNYYLNDRVSKVFINNLMQRGKIHPAFVSSSIDFTHDEIKILNLISKEQTNQQIADTMCKSIRTIEKHKTRMMEKVGAQNNVGLVLYAIKHKIIEI